MAASVTAVLALASACSSAHGRRRQRRLRPLSVVGYSVLEAANKPVFADFQDTERRQGRGVSSTSYGASGDQSRAVDGGLDADVVHFSLETDVTRLVDAGIVDSTTGRTTRPRASRRPPSWSSWSARATRTNIQTWDDIVKPGVEIITPNPGSSGSARWNILAAWAHIAGNGGSEEEAKALPDEAAQQHDRAAEQRPRRHHVVHRGQRRRAAVLRERGHPRQAGRCRRRLRRARGHPADREPGRRHQGRLPDRRRRSWSSSPRPTAQEDYAKSGFRPVVDGVDRPRGRGRQRPLRPVPDPEEAVHHRRRLRRLGRRGERSSSTTARTAARWASSRSCRRTPASRARNDHARPAPTGPDASAPARPPSRRGRRSGRATSTLTRSSGIGLGVAMIWFSLLVLIPLAALVVTATAGGWDQYVTTLSNPQTWAAIRLTGEPGALRHAAQRRAWARSSPGCWSATTSRARPCSTSSSTSRSRCRRSWPAWCCSRSTARTARSGWSGPTPNARSPWPWPS